MCVQHDIWAREKGRGRRREREWGRGKESRGKKRGGEDAEREGRAREGKRGRAFIQITEVCVG